MLSKAETILKHNLLFGMDCSKLIEKLKSGAIYDNCQIKIPDHWWMNDSRNGILKEWKMDLFKFIIQTPILKARSIDPLTNKLSMNFCGDYIKHCDEFMEHLVFIAHAAWALPLRGTKFLIALKCNTSFGIRNVYIIGDTLTLASTYSKTRALTMKERIKIRFADQHSYELIMKFEIFCSSLLEYCLHQVNLVCSISQNSNNNLSEAQTDYRLLQFRIAGKPISLEKLSNLIQKFFS